MGFAPDAGTRDGRRPCLTDDADRGAAGGVGGAAGTRLPAGGVPPHGGRAAGRPPGGSRIN